jgi:hypothetical protein
MRPTKKPSRGLTQPQSTQSQQRLQEPQDEDFSGDEKDPYAEKIHFLFSLLERVRITLILDPHSFVLESLNLGFCRKRRTSGYD